MSPQRRVVHCMGTVFSFDVREPGVDAGVLDETERLLHRIDETYSTYRPDSVISRLGRGAPTTVPEEVRAVLAECASWRTRTGGWFSAYAAGSLDPSGYVKGWAIQQASDLLRRAGSSNHCVNGGGDVQCAGSADGQPWRVGVADPDDPQRVLTVIAGTGIAVATSGTAERGEHVLDPHTGRPPAASLRSLTVAGHSVLECDVLATAGFAIGPGAHEWFASTEGLPPVQVFGVLADGSTFSTASRSQVGTSVG